ncbi:MAG: DUF4349 domain-containing protein [Planctomycetota bacterium]
MECHEARLLIDERVHGAPAAGLDEHLQLCANCREDLRQLAKLRELLNVAKNDAPPKGALAAIWQAIRQTISSTNHIQRRRAPMTTIATTSRRFDDSVDTRWKRWRTTIAISLSAAALLMLSFLVGQLQQKPSIRSARVTEASSGFLDKAQRSEPLITELAPSDSAVGSPDSCLTPSVKDMDESKSRGGISSRSKESRSRASAHDRLLTSTPPPASKPAAPAMLADSAELKKTAFGSHEARQLAEKSQPTDAVVPPELPYDQRRGESNAVRKIAADNKDAGDKQGAADDKSTQSKIIKTGELTIEVKNYVEAGRAVDALVIKYQGFVADSRAYDLPGATKRSEIVIRMAPEKFEELFAELKKIGVVLQERAGGQDITAAYTDTEARIKNMRIAEERLQELIKSKTFMDKIQSLLEVERELSRVRGEIERMQGQMRVWQNQLSLSTIRLTLQEPSRAVPAGSLSVEVPGLVEAKKTLDAAITNVGGQLLSGQTSKRGDGTLMGNYTLRVKFGRFVELVGAIKTLGRAQDEHIQNQPFGTSIPDGAQDVPCNLALVLFERSIQLPNGSLNLEVVSLSEAMSKLDVALAAAQASIISNQTQRQDDGSSQTQINLCVRAGNFTTLVNALPVLGRITHRVVNGEAGKILGGAADVPATLSLHLVEQRKQVPSGNMTVEVNSFAEARDKLSLLIKEHSLQVFGSDSQQRGDGTWTGKFRLGIKAEKMDTVVSLLEKYGHVKTRQIQGLGLGDLSKVDPNVIGEVVLVFAEKPSLAPQEEGSFRLMLRDTFGGFLSSMGFVIRGFGMLLPWVILAGLVVWLISRFSRRALRTARDNRVAPPTDLDATKK